MKKAAILRILAISALISFRADAKIQYLQTDDDALGITPLADSWNTWTTSPMALRTAPGPGDRVVTGDDFFLREFGEKLKPFVFTDGYRSETWGRTKANPDAPAIRFGRGWGESQGRRWGVRVDVTQDADETAWTLTIGRTYKFKIAAPKGRRTRLIVPVGWVRKLQQYSSLSFACLTTNVAVKVHSFEIVPFAEPIHWRGTFVLGFKPWKAGLSFKRRNHYALKINGRMVSQGLNLDNAELLREDITAFLHAGTNVFDVVTERVDGYSNEGELSLEAFAVSAKGERALLLGGPDWKAKYRTSGWMPVKTLPQREGTDWSPGKVRCCTGVNPLHAGPLQVRHLGSDYPVFDTDSKEIAYELAVPPKMEGLEVSLVVSNSLAGKVVEKQSLKAAGRTKVLLKTRAGGPYRLYWTLSRNGRAVDHDSMECIIAGPIEQTQCSFNEFDKVLESRLRLVQERDCVPEEKDPAKFAEHGAIYSDYTRANIKSKVVRENGIAFREAGRMPGDWFGYKLDVKNTGIPHILEVVYPDTHEQVLYVSVCENLPANFCNHGPGCANRLCNATGAVRTGWMAPLSHTRKTMRILFFPASKNVTVTFENYLRASVCAFRVYEVPEGLPALKLPETDRVWGVHCERPLTGMWGAAANAKACRVFGEYFENAYLAAYLGIKNRIAQLRYFGQNLAIEGVYMYRQYFPTLSGESGTPSPSFDYCYIMSKMYRHNKIRALAGFEYFASPALISRNAHDIGEREMRAAKTPLTPSFGVDRFGRQTIVFGEAGLNHLAPHVRHSMTNLVGEIYRRYEPTGGFDGLFVICNNGWIPGFCSERNRYTEREVGYDDLSIELFQKETGISLGIDYTPERFAKRYDVLNRRYSHAWYSWRTRKVREMFDEFATICSGGARKWKIYAVPGVEHKQDNNPFTRMMSSAAERDGYCEKIFREGGFPAEVYPNEAASAVGLVPRMKFARELDLPLWGVQTSRSAREMYARTDAVYLEPIGLNERWLSTETLQKWWWDGTSSVVFDCKASAPATFFDMVDICAGHAPKMMVHNWLDVNIPTGHGRESRRFATGFAAMPVGTYRPFPAVKGVQAEICGDDAVRLVNDTPYEIRGELAARRFGIPVSVEDAFDGKLSGRFRYTLPGFGITVLRAEGIAKKLSGAFRFADGAIEAKTLRRAAALAESTAMLGRVSSGVRARFLSAWAAKDIYRLAAVMRDYEIVRVAGKFFDLVLDAPQRPADELKIQAKYDGPEQTYTREQPHGGCAAVDPAARDTARKMTLSFLVKTDGRGADLMTVNALPFRFDIRTFAGREKIDGTGLHASITCFRRKPGQKGWYSVGMPQWDGAAKDVWHHVCMTVDPEGVAAVWVDGVLVDARELTDHRGLEFEPAQTGISFGRVCPKGQERAGIRTARMVRREGVMDWRDIQKEAAEWLSAVHPRLGVCEVDARGDRIAAETSEGKRK